jgi:hypothetical protein
MTSDVVGLGLDNRFEAPQPSRHQLLPSPSLRPPRTPAPRRPQGPLLRGVVAGALLPPPSDKAERIFVDETRLARLKRLGMSGEVGAVIRRDLLPRVVG